LVAYFLYHSVYGVTVITINVVTISTNQQKSHTAYTAAGALNADVISDVVVGNIRHHSDQVGRFVNSTA